ncbi:MAG: Type secretion system, TssN [Bacteroidota bacterium]|jgi:hypothetical protein
MKDVLTLLYLAGGLLFTAVFLWGIYTKLRKLDGLTLVHVLILLLTSAAAGCFLTTVLQDSIHLAWMSRLVLLGIGFILSWGVYRLAWSQRHPFDFNRDSFETELCFVGGMAAFMGFLFLKIPALWNETYSPNWEYDYWDAGIILLVPFLIHKTWDAFTQIHYPDVENPWVFPDKFINVAHWKWRELTQVNFEIAKNLDSEYNLFAKPVLPWIEVPKEQPIGDVFALMVQERRKNPSLTSIQDLGTEYSGEPPFWLLFSIKQVWWKPSTWKRKNRYLYPDLSVAQNEMQPEDVIVVQRIPFSGQGRRPNLLYATPYYDPGKTTIIQR